MAFLFKRYRECGFLPSDPKESPISSSLQPLTGVCFACWCFVVIFGNYVIGFSGVTAADVACSALKKPSLLATLKRDYVKPTVDKVQGGGLVDFGIPPPLPGARTYPKFTLLLNSRRPDTAAPVKCVELPEELKRPCSVCRLREGLRWGRSDQMFRCGACDCYLNSYKVC
jgi:hypothetical protein